MFNSGKDWQGMFNDLNKVFNDLTEKTTEISQNWQKQQNPRQEKPKKDVVSNHLSKEDLMAFKGLCALEGITESEKMAELIKRYLVEKRNNL
jgi:hypothetical protein